MPGRPDDKISQRLQAWRARVEATRAEDLYFFNQPIEELRGGSRVFLKGREMLMFASYSYLGLIGHPRITAAAQAAAAQYGTGTHGVRLLAGSLRLHTELEETIARFKEKEKALLFTAGYLANVGTLSGLAGEGDLILLDKLCHASLIDGARLSKAEVRSFPHKN